ncbi:MAG TPA: hypothetical protein VGJ30_20880 [Candidatus Angelobacter sp.]
MTILALLFGLTNAIARGAPPTASNTLLATGFTLPYGAQVLTGTAALTNKLRLWASPMALQP